jgi:hypothetical protein
LLRQAILSIAAMSKKSSAFEGLISISIFWGFVLKK